jgi:hypothetical protein
MIRHALGLFVLGTAAITVSSGAEAGSCCNCPAPCATEPVVEVVVEAHAPAPFYVVDQGPIFTGPGIVSFPTIRKMHQSIGDYPFIGYGHGGYRHRVAYVDVKRAHHRMYRRAPVVPMVRPPLNPRDK